MPGSQRGDPHLAGKLGGRFGENDVVSPQPGNSSRLHPCRPASYDQYRSFCICGRQTIVAHFAFPPDIGIDRAPHTPFRTEQHSDATLIAANARSEEHTSETKLLMSY